MRKQTSRGPERIVDLLLPHADARRKLQRDAASSGDTDAAEARIQECGAVAV